MALIIMFFDMKVEVVALSSYEEKEEKFKEEVALLLLEAIHYVSDSFWPLHFFLLVLICGVYLYIYVHG